MSCRLGSWVVGQPNWQDTNLTKKDYILMFYWTRCRYHGNKAGSKPALNNGFDLFSENLVVRFFPHHLSLENWENNGLLTLVL